MKGLRIKEDELLCLIEDAVLKENNSYSRIKGDITKGYTVEPSKSVENIIENGWSELYPSLECENNEFKVIAGETSWGGTGFVAIKNIKTNLFKWVLHLSTMNNPIKIKIENDLVRVTTDLNYPDGIDFIIPIQEPEKFRTERTVANICNCCTGG